MMLNLIGVYECKIDSKGRIQIAVGLKKQLASMLEEGFIIKRSVFNKCLELYPRNEWDKQSKKISQLNPFVQKNIDFIRIFMAGVKTVTLKNAGRLQIPKDLVKYANLEKEIVLASSLNRIEIWEKENYEKIIRDKLDDFAALAEDVMGGIKMDTEEDE